MLSSVRRDIINKINNKLNNATFMREFCNFFDNEPRKVIRGISLFIKISFFDSTSPYTMYINDPNLVNERYFDFVNSNRSLLDVFKKGVDPDLLPLELDRDINFKDLDGIKLPSLNTILNYCGVNKEDVKEFTRKRNKRDEELDLKRGFNEVGFLYTTIENVVFNSEFCYYHPDLSGDLIIDFNELYSDHKYRNNSLSPLNNTLKANIESIRESQDFDLKRLGDVYEIKNGRHRILYLMRNNYSESIPVHVSKRFEDRELNILLRDIRKSHNVVVLKNNICNDFVDLCFVYNGKLYRLSDRESVFDFCKYIDDTDYISKYFVCDFEVYKNKPEGNFIRYRDLLVKKFLSSDVDLFENDFTDILSMFNEKNTYLYDAYKYLQVEGLKLKLSGYDFRTYLRLLEGIADTSNDTLSDIKVGGIKR